MLLRYADAIKFFFKSGNLKLKLTVFIFKLRNMFALMNIRRGDFWFESGTIVSAIRCDDFTGIRINFADKSVLSSGAFLLIIIVRFGSINVGNAGAFIELFNNCHANSRAVKRGLFWWGSEQERFLMGIVASIIYGMKLLIQLSRR